MDLSASASDIQLAILKELQKPNGNVQEQTKLLQQQDATNVLVKKALMNAGILGGFIYFARLPVVSVPSTMLTYEL